MRKITILQSWLVRSSAREARQRRASILISVITLDLDIAITTMAPATGTGTGIEGSVTASGATADTIGPADFELLTDVRTVGPFKTASVSPIAATEPRAVRRN